MSEAIFFDIQTPRTNNAFDAVARDLKLAIKWLESGQFALAAEAVATANDHLRTLCDALATKETA